MMMPGSVRAVSGDFFRSGEGTPPLKCPADMIRRAMHNSIRRWLRATDSPVTFVERVKTDAVYHLRVFQGK
jgi:hypothetical protein